MKPDASRAGPYVDKLYNWAIMAVKRPIRSREAGE
jgi:hypothetical protein